MARRLALIAALIAGCEFQPGVAAVADAVMADGTAAMWAHKRRVTIQNIGLGELASFGLVIALDTSRITYGSAAEHGEDLRFTDAAGSFLPYEIESWNPTGSSIIWVGVATITANATTTLWMYYGNPAAIDAQQPKQVWDASYVGVWHLADERDSTGNNMSINLGATPVTGVVGPAMNFAGSPQAIDTGSSDQLAAFTLEAWMQPASPATAVGASGPIARGGNYQLQWNCDSSPFCESANVELANGTYAIATYGTPPAGVWSYVAATYDGAALRVFLNEMPVTAVMAPAPLLVETGTAKIGAHLDLSNYFVGNLDEIRISSVARSLDYIVAQHRAMTDSYVSFGPELASP